MRKACIIIMLICTFNLTIQVLMICFKNGGLYYSLFGALNVINLLMYACLYEETKKGH